MFGSKELEELNKTGEQAQDTIIGSTIKIEGDLVSNGNIVVEGEVVGSLKTDRGLRVGANAKVKADVKAAQALIAGEVAGNVVIDDTLELTETARVSGDISARVISIQSGALFNGRCSMNETPGAGAKPVEAVEESEA
jgi:cytoskeletal protein CcmA (bactofilin family)